MHILSPTDITSNKICQWPLAQQAIGLAMLHKIYSLFLTRSAYNEAQDNKQIVAEQMGGQIQVALNALNIEKAQLDTYKSQMEQFQRGEHLKPRSSDTVLTKEDQEASDKANLALQDRYKELLDLQQARINDVQQIYNDKIAERELAFNAEDVKIEAARVLYQSDKDYLKVALQRMLFFWGTYISREALKKLQRTAPAA